MARKTLIEILTELKLTNAIATFERERIENCASAEDFNGLASDFADWAADRGVTTLYSADFDRKQEVVSSLLKHYMFYRTQAEIAQFKEGLGLLWGSVEEFSEQFKPLFTAEGQPVLNRTRLKELMKINWSEKGSNLRLSEEDTIFSFECEDGKTRISMSELLAFITVADRVPTLGFESKISVNFFTKQAQLRGYPTASTCALEVHLPRGVEDPMEFSQLFEEAVICGKGFGKI